MRIRDFRRISISTGVILALAAAFYVNAVQIVSTGSLSVVVTFFIIGAISAYNLARANTYDGISLRVVFWFFCFMFFAFTPYLKYLVDRFGYPLSDTSMLLANCLILLHLILVQVSYSYQVTATGRKLSELKQMISRSYEKISPAGLLIAILMSYGIAIFVIARNGLSLDQIFGMQEDFSPLEQMMRFYLRPFTFFAFLFAVVYLRTRSRRSAFAIVMVVAAFIPAVLLNFPFSTNRFYVFAIYLGFLIIIWPPSAKNRGVYLASLFSGIIVSFVVQAFFHASLDDDVFDISYLTGTTFDAYESFVYSIDYAALNGITWGRQLLGGLLFWIPREWWPDKPIGTGGLIIAELHGATFTNVSSPFLEEGYINFSVPGILLYSIFLGRVMGQMDTKRKWLMRRLPERWPPKTDIYLVFYPLMVGFLLFALRGDFMSSFSYISGVFCSFLTVRTIVCRLARD